MTASRAKRCQVCVRRVSAPLKWSEVRRGLDPGKFTIKTMPKRIDRFGDLWRSLLGEGIDGADCLGRLEKQFK